MKYELAQLNIAKLSAPIDSPALVDFVDNLDRINALAENSLGFVWRDIEPADEQSTSAQPFGDDYIVNLSSWADIDSLHHYVYRTAHAQIMARRKEWFDRVSDATTVLWWVPEGHKPSRAEAADRLELLRKHGPTNEAFTFKKSWPAPDSDDKAEI